jgi:hypothetical protein
LAEEDTKCPALQHGSQDVDSKKSTGKAVSQFRAIDEVWLTRGKSRGEMWSDIED